MSCSPLRAKKRSSRTCSRAATRPPRTPWFNVASLAGTGSGCEINAHFRRWPISPQTSTLNWGVRGGHFWQFAFWEVSVFFARDGMEISKIANSLWYKHICARSHAVLGRLGRAEPLWTTPIADAPSWILSRATLTPACRGLPPRWPKKCSKWFPGG